MGKKSHMVQITNRKEKFLLSKTGNGFRVGIIKIMKCPFFTNAGSLFVKKGIARFIKAAHYFFQE